MFSSYTIPGKEKRLMLINGDAFEDAFFLNEIVIECPCLIPPDAFAHAPHLRRVVFRGNGVMSSFLEEDFVNDLEGDYIMYEVFPAHCNYSMDCSGWCDYDWDSNCWSDMD